MTRVFVLSCCVLIGACSSPPMLQQSGYPTEIKGVGESKNFPLKAAGYSRGRIVMYAPGMSDYSVGYNLSEPSIQNAVTLYFRIGSASLDEQFEAEKRQIAAFHRDAALLKEDVAQFEKNGIAYSARVAKYQLRGVFGNRQQNLSSELILVSHPARFLKVRSTAPLAHASDAEAKTRELMESINWAY